MKSRTRRKYSVYTVCHEFSRSWSLSAPGTPQPLRILLPLVVSSCLQARRLSRARARAPLLCGPVPWLRDPLLPELRRTRTCARQIHFPLLPLRFTLSVLDVSVTPRIFLGAVSSFQVSCVQVGRWAWARAQHQAVSLLYRGPAS